MRYLYKRGDGAKNRVMHLTMYDQWSGKPTMFPLCGTSLRFDTTCNLPLGQRICRRCTHLAGQAVR